MKIAIGAYHAGYKLKEFLKKVLSEKFEIEDFGTHSPEPVDYPDYAIKVAKYVANGYADVGILICGTGIGMSIAANKVKGITMQTFFV
jgi:ribose 5-phosphate isomerase B